MKVAIFQGFLGGHYEMIGHAVDYCIARGYDFEVFTITQGCEDASFVHDVKKRTNYTIGELDIDHWAKHDVMWRAAFDAIFPGKIVWRDVYEFNPDNFTKTINLTSDYSLWNSDFDLRTDVISILHNRHAPRTRQSICVRDFGLPGIPYALPVFNMVSLETKSKFRSERVSVLIIGEAVNSTPQWFLKLIFKNFSEIDFHYINKIIITARDSCPNIFYHASVPATDFIDLLLKSHYILGDPGNENYYRECMSSVMLNAYSCGARLLVRDTWEYPDLKTPLRYNFDSRLTLEPPDLESIFAERDALITHRNAVYDAYFSNWFLEHAGPFPPKVFVETGTYRGDGVLNAFREIHSIELSEEFAHGDSAPVLEKLSETLNEPTLFFLDAHNHSDLLRELEVLGKRTQADVVVVVGKKARDAYNLQAIFETYNRSGTYHYDSVTDRLVLQAHQSIKK
jgi:hypothetical protein